MLLEREVEGELVGMLPEHGDAGVGGELVGMLPEHGDARVGGELVAGAVLEKDPETQRGLRWRVKMRPLG